jgi:L-malate glycosyltransferase
MQLATRTAPTPSATAAGPPHSVCLVIGQLGLGGAEKQLVLLACGLHQRGVRVTVVTLFGGGPREKDLRQVGVPVVHLGSADLSAGPTGVLRAATLVARLTGHLRHERPDLVHAFLYHAYVLATPAARLAGVPLVAGRRSLGTFLDGRPIAQWVQRVATRHTRLLVANAYAVADDARRREHLPDGKLSVIYNGLPQEAFTAASPAIVEHPAGPVVVCVANLRAYKGHRDLLEAAAVARDRGCPCTLILIGSGAEHDALRDQADDLGIDVRLLGQRDDVAAWLARADLVVLASRTEGMSNAVMEAMAASRAVVATDVGGTAELLRGRGVVVAPRSPQALADAMMRLLADPAERARLGENARRFAREHLRADVMVERHLDLYRSRVVR